MPRDVNRVRTIPIAGFLLVLLTSSVSCNRGQPVPASQPAQIETKPALRAPAVDEPIPVAEAAARDPVAILDDARIDRDRAERRQIVAPHPVAGRFVAVEQSGRAQAG